MQKNDETLQELSMDIQRLSLLAYSAYPADVREFLALQHFIDAVRDREVQKALRLSNVKDIRSALEYSLKYEAVQLASGQNREAIRGLKAEDHSSLIRELIAMVMDLKEQVQKLSTQQRKRNEVKCWSCNSPDHLRNNCPQLRKNQNLKTSNLERKSEQDLPERKSNVTSVKPENSSNRYNTGSPRKSEKPSSANNRAEVKYKKNSERRSIDSPDSKKEKCSTISHGSKTENEQRIERCKTAVNQIRASKIYSPDPWSSKELRRAQLEDPDVRPILELRESSSCKPTWQDISSLSPNAKHYWTLWDSLRIRDGVLYRRWESDGGKALKWLIILPRSKVSDVLKELHSSPTGVHFGVVKTLQKVRERFYWLKSKEDVEKWCQSCDVCSARKELRQPLDLPFDHARDTPSSPKEYLEDFQARFEDILKFARERLNLATMQNKTRTKPKVITHDRLAKVMI